MDYTDINGNPIDMKKEAAEHMKKIKCSADSCVIEKVGTSAVCRKKRKKKK